MKALQRFLEAIECIYFPDTFPMLLPYYPSSLMFPRR